MAAFGERLAKLLRREPIEVHRRPPWRASGFGAAALEVPELEVLPLEKDTTIASLMSRYKVSGAMYISVSPKRVRMKFR